MRVLLPLVHKQFPKQQGDSQPERPLKIFPQVFRLADLSSSRQRLHSALANGDQALSFWAERSVKPMPRRGDLLQHVFVQSGENLATKLVFQKAELPPLSFGDLGPHRRADADREN